MAVNLVVGMAQDHGMGGSRGSTVAAAYFVLLLCV